MTLVSAMVLLILVMDPLGNVPSFMAVLADVDASKHRRIIFRELCIALGILVTFLFAGGVILRALHVSQPALSIAGGTILFLIALGMIFSIERKLAPLAAQSDPLIVPLAVPLIAGPSAVATVMLLMSQDPSRWLEWLGAVICSWLVVLAVLMLSAFLKRALGDRVLTACQKLMGMILTTIAIQMFMDGVSSFLAAEGS